MSFQNITIAGASGDLGSRIFNRFSQSNLTIRVLKRAGSSSTFPEGTDVVEVDYSSLESLTAALKGQHVLISTLTTLAAGDQDTLIDAAVAAGVQRIIPSEFGSNLDVPSVRSLPVYTAKVKIQENIIEKSKSTPLSYTFVYNSIFFDWGLEHNFFINFTDSTASIIDGGDHEFSTTTLTSVADAVFGIVSHPEETKNRVVYIQDTVLTQNKILELAKKANPSKEWTVTQVKLDDLTARSDERLSQGLYDMETFGPYLFRAIYDPSSKAKFEKLDNELLGVKGKTDEEVYELIKSVS